jgi:cell division protein FtsW
MSRRNREKSHRALTGVILSSPDRTILLVVMFLVIVGLMTIFSATAPKCLTEGSNPAQFLFKQFVNLIVGFCGLKFFTNYDYKKLPKWDFIVFATILTLLVLVDFTPLGVVINGAKRWISIAGFQLQPSEFAKQALILLFASAFKDNASLFDQKKWIVAILPILVMIGLIFIQPNLSMVILLLVTTIVMYLSAGGSFRLFFTSLGIMVAGLIVMATTIIKPYQMQRLQTWMNPDLDPLGAGYNIIQSLIAFAAGGLWGAGYGGSIQKLQYLPECHTDFIFAVFAEEFGFIGCVLLIGLFFTFIQRGFLIASRCPDMYGKILAVGITFSIGFQAFMNMSVASAFLPATGIPLPFISYGGSSLMVSLWMVGILLNISRKRIKMIKGEQQHV